MFSAAVVLTLTAFVQPSAFAFAQSQGGSQVHVPSFTGAQQKVVNLTPITVHDHRLPFPIRLQLYKKALTRPWSSSWNDRNKLVCRWVTPVGTHLQRLRCETNRMHRQAIRTLRTAWVTALSVQSHTFGDNSEILSMIPVENANATIKKPIPRGAMAPLLKKLPPANASYTLRVTGDNGKPLIDYVIEGGNLVHIREYVYKKKGGSSGH